MDSTKAHFVRRRCTLDGIIITPPLGAGGGWRDAVARNGGMGMRPSAESARLSQELEMKIFRRYENKDLELCLIDVSSGSDTRLMVKQVLEWSKAQGNGMPFSDP